MKFTDGEPLTASDVAFTFNTCRDESSVNDFTMLKEAVAVDDTTVEFHMNEPYSIWPYTMAIVGIVPEHAYDENYGQNPIGSGRYIMKQWDKGQQVILKQTRITTEKNQRSKTDGAVYGRRCSHGSGNVRTGRCSSHSSLLQ